MSGGAGAGTRGNGPAAAAVSVPAGSRKLVQSLKEIVNCSEAEIYAMLRECNMDPNEAVHRLLSQDIFHEVKSKRDKKKETREPPESRARTVSSSSSRARGGTERVTRSTYSQSTSIEHGTSKGKVTHKKENGTSTLPASSFLEPSTFSSNPPQRPTVPSNSTSMENAIQAATIADVNSIPVQSSSGFQSSWLGRPGHMSMADIVKRGRPQVKSASIPPMASERSYTLQNAATSNLPHHDVKQPTTDVLIEESDEIPESFKELSRVSEISQDLGIADSQHISQDGWSLDEQPMESRSTTPETSGVPAVYTNKPELVVDRSNLNIDSHLEEIQLSEDSLNVTTLPAESRSTSVADRQKLVDTSLDAVHSNEDLVKSMNPHQSERVELDHHEAGDARMEVSSAAADLRQLSLNEETNTRHIEANPAVIIPDHLRVTNADCAHLSFGSFVSGTFSGSFPSEPLKNNLEVAPVVDDASTVNDSDLRNQENYSDEQLRPTLTEHVATRPGTGSENLDMPSASQAEVVRNDSLDAAHGLQYNLPSVSSYTFSSTTQPTATTYAYPQGNTQMQNLSTFSSLMQANALQSSLLAASIPSLRDFDLPLSPLLTTQSLPTSFSTLSSASGPSISMPEALNQGAFSNPQSAPQSLPSTTMLTSPALAQHLPVHHYSQPALPLSHFANMISYPFLPQSYTYLPSFPNSAFHQAPATVPGAGMKYSQPQYKSSVPVASLPQASAIASAYGGFGSSANIPGTLNHSTASVNTTIGLDEALSLQYKDGNYMSLQQSENPAMWIHSAGARTMSALPPNTFYNYQGQSQLGGLRQSQQSSAFGALGYPSLYHSHTGPSREHQQNPSEGNLNGSQSMQSQQSNQIWQHGY
ncbi:hypothetical protein Cni_G29429 [Canna indica]|uniref:GBF-interacting protein 1 N-terminal domain-containing protein n=1 Tax=Canna indica TaxID=4628 RepID=A0AAQ3QR95_9LILI|nr:hypothetical protein Cni_G29429 [Canna indica]